MSANKLGVRAVVLGGDSGISYEQYIRQHFIQLKRQLMDEA